MPLGAEGAKISLGSLDFLNSESVPVQFALSPADMGIATLDATRVSGRGPRGAAQGETATLPDLDLAIMNPPFTRSVGGNLMSAACRREIGRTSERTLAPLAVQTSVRHRRPGRGLRRGGLAQA